MCTVGIPGKYWYMYFLINDHSVNHLRSNMCVLNKINHKSASDSVSHIADYWSLSFKNELKSKISNNQVNFKIMVIRLLHITLLVWYWWCVRFLLIMLHARWMPPDKYSSTKSATSLNVYWMGTINDSVCFLSTCTKCDLPLKTNLSTSA